MSLLLKLWHFGAVDSFEPLTMAADFLCQTRAEWPQVNFQKRKKKKRYGPLSLDLSFLIEWLLSTSRWRCSSPQCVWWRLSNGCGMWEAGSQSGGRCCGQVVAAISVLCTANILLQWVVSTHRHFIHTGRQAGLPTPHIHPISLWKTTNLFLFLFIQTFLLYFEA